MMHLRDMCFCAPLRSEFTTERGRLGKQGGIPILLFRILILLSCCMPLALCGRICGATTTTAAVMTSPAAGSALTSASTTFTWSAGSGGVTGYYLWIGTSAGTANLANIGFSSSTTQATVTLPTNGATIYVQLWTQFSGGSLLSNSYTYTEVNVAAATMTSPAPGSTLTSASTTFNWTASPGAGGVTGYYLWIGTSAGTANLANIGLSSTTTQATVTLPTNGATIYVQLWTQFSGGNLLSNSYTYTEVNVAAATMTSPAPGSTLTSASTTFTWSAGSGGVTGYYLWIGTSAGTANLANIGVTGTSATVNLPTNGATIYAELWTKLSSGALLSNSYTYTEVNVAAATMTSPAPGSTLTSASTTFTWSAGSGGVTGYYLWVGTSAGAANLANIGVTGTSATVNLPTSGATIYVELWTKLSSGALLSNSYTYTEVNVTAAAMTSPAPGSTLTSASTTFTWSAGSGGVTGYYLWVGISAGTANLANIGVTGTSATVNLPTNGATIYVELWTKLSGGALLSNSYTYTAASSSPTLSVNATTIAFGNVNLNSPATQTLILTSTGSAAVTVSAATVTGSGFTVSGVTFPITLNPNQTATLSVQFDPTVAGAVTGQLTITSNSSTGSSAVVSLTGTGAAASHQVSLSWNAPTNSADPVAGYNVYRALSGNSSYTQLNSTAMTQTTYTDTNVTNGQTYDYIVESVDASGIQSVPSNTAVVSIP